MLHRTEVISDRAGRPPLSVDMYEVEFLRSLGFSWTDVANLLRVSRSTLYRRIELSSQGYTSISDVDLDQLVHQLKTDHPKDGEVMIAAHLKSTGVRVPRSRLCASIHRVDPHAHDRLKPSIHRRVYSVIHQILYGTLTATTR